MYSNRLLREGGGGGGGGGLAGGSLAPRSGARVAQWSLEQLWVWAGAGGWARAPSAEEPVRGLAAGS